MQDSMNARSKCDGFIAERAKKRLNVSNYDFIMANFSEGTQLQPELIRNRERLIIIEREQRAHARIMKKYQRFLSEERRNRLRIKHEREVDSLFGTTEEGSLKRNNLKFTAVDHSKKSGFCDKNTQLLCVKDKSTVLTPNREKLDNRNSGIKSAYPINIKPD